MAEVRERLKNAILLALMMEEGEISQGKAGSHYKLNKANKQNLPPNPQSTRRNEPCQHLDLSPVGPILDFSPPVL